MIRTTLPFSKKNRYLTIFTSMFLLVLFSAFAFMHPKLSAGDAKKTWAEKLGFPKGKTVLLLHMDDIGMCPEANTAAENYINNKQIMSAAVMMPCPNATAFIEWAKQHPVPDIGLHLALTSEW